MNSQRVRKLVEENRVVILRADFTRGDPAVAELLRRLGNPSGSIPFYAVFPAKEPQRPIVFDGVITAGQVVEVLRQAGPSLVESSPKTASQQSPAVETTPGG